MEPKGVAASAAALGTEEQHLGSVVVALGARGGSERAAADRARGAAAPLGARVDLLEDGTIVAALEGKGSARDQARQAARCALALRDVLEDVPIALATGRATLGAGRVFGEVIDRALAMMRTRAAAPAATRRARPIALDETTAGLLDATFEVVGDEAHLALRRERPDESLEMAPRTVLGRATPFVGREREIATLEAVFRECAGDDVAHVVVVTSPSGVGKSRLRRELVRSVRERDSRAEIWIARGDPMSAGSPLGMLAQVVRATAGALEGETLRTRQAKLVARLSRHLAGDDLSRVAEFLGELAGIRFPEAKSVQLKAARRNPTLMGDQMRRAWEDFLAAECAAQPVLVVLEDLHWGDLPTVSFLDDALRSLRERPLMILALAQPDVHRLFPQLWSSHPRTELRLGELSRKASERLVREALRDRVAVDDATVVRIVDRAAGNAFYLEELVRSVAEGREDLPATIVAMVQARFESLPADARRVLRAASVFGQTFWKEGVAALLAGTAAERGLSSLLDELEKREFVSPRDHGGRFEGEYVFRHAIVRDTAYATLTDDDRALGHRLAAEWLDRAGEVDAMSLAEQFERGGEPTRAAECYERAAAQALESNDLAAAIERVKKGIACGARGERLGALLVTQSMAHTWRGEYDEVAQVSKEALALLPRASARWYHAAGELVMANARLGRVEGIEALVERMCDPSMGEDAGSARIIAWTRAAGGVVFAGLHALADTILQRVDRVPYDADDPTVVARIHHAKATRAVAMGDLSAFLEHTEASIAPFERSGDVRMAIQQRLNVGYSQMMLGAYAEAEQTQRAVLAASDKMGLAAMATIARQNLGRILAYRGALQEARAIEETAVEGTTVSGDKIMAAASYTYLAEILTATGKLEAAERAARDAITTLGGRVNAVGVQAHAALARVLLATKRTDEALRAARESIDVLSKLGGVVFEAAARLVHAEALHASGDPAAARDAMRTARKRLLARAATIGSPALRKSFLENVPDNVRTLKLAAEWCDA